LIQGSGELLPLYPCVGSSVSDGESSHALNFGKKLHLTTERGQHTIYVAGQDMLYLLWLFPTERDFVPIPGSIDAGANKAAV
jgi:hypothetical protein